MRIIETRDITEVLRCVPMEMEIRKKGRDHMPIRDMLSLVKENFEHNPLFHFFLIFEDDSDNLIGYFAIIIRPQKEFRTINLYRIWHDGSKEVRDKIEEIITQIAKETKCRRLTIEVYKNESSIERLYGFRKSSTVMERRI
jgi:hypothetical protein